MGRPQVGLVSLISAVRLISALGALTVIIDVFFQSGRK